MQLAGFDGLRARDKHFAPHLGTTRRGQQSVVRIDVRCHYAFGRYELVNVAILAVLVRPKA
jgi:hypothetical protein